jgi:hypothetical protein
MGKTLLTNAKSSAVMVEEDLWDMGNKWKTLSEKPSNTARPNEEALDSTNQSSKTMTPANPTIKMGTTNTIQVENSVKEKLLERMAGDKSEALSGMLGLHVVFVSLSSITYPANSVNSFCPALSHIVFRE